MELIGEQADVFDDRPCRIEKREALGLDARRVMHVLEHQKFEQLAARRESPLSWRLGPTEAVDDGMREAQPIGPAELLSSIEQAVMLVLDEGLQLGAR